MGNLDSKYKFEHGNIYCQTDKAYFVAGENITGKIYLNLSLSFPAHSLEIEVKGKEKCKWVTRENQQVKNGEETKNEFVDVVHKGENKILTYKVPVYYFPGGMAPAGQYTFPFSFALPSNIPATLFFCGIDKAMGNIKYKLKATLEPSLGFNVKKMKFKQTLVIRQPHYASALNPMQTDARNVYACCCFGNKGQARITTQFERDGYTPEEVCRAMCDIDNSQCSGEIRNITIRLQQHVELRSKDGREYHDNRIISQKQFDGLGPNQSTGGLNRYLELNLATIKQQPRSFEDHKSLDKDDLYLAERIQPTSKGAIVKLHYTLTVNCDYGTCCAEEPHCTIPLTITPPPLPSFGQVEAPPGWAPVMFNTFQFSLPGPGEVISAAASQTATPVDINFNFNAVPHEEVKVQAKFSPKMNLQIDTDKINMEVPIPVPVPVPAPVPVKAKSQAPVPVPVPVPLPVPSMQMKVHSHDSSHGSEDHVSMDVNFGGFPGMNMQFEGKVDSNVTYTSETTVNGVKTSYSSSSRADHIPVPVPVPAPVPAPGPANAQFTMNNDLSMGAQVSVTGEDGQQVSAQVNFPGMHMGMHFNADED